MSDCFANPLSPADKKSFAYETLKDRLPVIVTKIIDYLHRDREEIAATVGQNTTDDIKLTTGRLAQLKNEMQTDKPLTTIDVDAEDAEIWNNYLNVQASIYGQTPTWYSSPWLYLECYMYRRIYQAFILSPTLVSFDYFLSQKKDAFHNSLEAISILGAHLHQKVTSDGDDHDLQQTFSQLFQICLWSNRCDLSISAGAENAQKENPVDVVESLKANILVDDTTNVWNYIQYFIKEKKSPLKLSVVMDNAGFELFCDLCLVYFMTTKNLVGSVDFYVKKIPWYISDTMESDIIWTLNSMKNMENNKILSHLGTTWLNLFNEKMWQIQVEKYWTLPFDYADMKVRDPVLYRKLGSSDFVLFKGDLNYRKLVGDRNWPPTTSFENALCGFTPTPLCTLRTLKADVIVGLQTGQAEDAAMISKNWMTSGEFAVIQFLNKTDVI